MLIYDEHREYWEVESGDPGYKAATYLSKIGFRNIILPLSVLMFGYRYSTFPWPTAQMLTQISIGPVDKFLHYAALYDQAEALAESGLFDYNEEAHDNR